MYSNDFKEFEPIGYLKLSKILYKNINQFKTSKCLYSSAKRTIVSRIYYSVYLVIKQYLVKHYDFDENRGGSHNYIPTFIIENNVFGEFNKYEIVNNLFILRKNRIQCDYKFVVPDNENTKLD